MRLTALATLLMFGMLAFAASAETQRRSDGTYSWDPRDWHWDKSEFDTPPTPVGGYAAFVSQLTYPTELRRRGIQGRGAARVYIDAAGRVRGIEFQPRMHPELEKVVVAAIQRTRFLPARRAGKPVRSVARIPVTFIPR